MTELPRRQRNHATGYKYSKHDHCQAWRMPDGAVFMSGWIDPGDTTGLDKGIAGRKEQIEKLQEELRTYELIREAVAMEDPEETPK